MIEVHFVLHGADQQPEDGPVHRYRHVPRVGEFITFDSHCSFVVADVLWHLDDPREPYVTVHVFERDWHANMQMLADVWRRSMRSAGEQDKEQSPANGWMTN